MATAILIVYLNSYRKYFNNHKFLLLMEMVDYEKLDRDVSKLFGIKLKVILLEGIYTDHVRIAGQEVWPVNGKYEIPLHDPTVPDDLPTYIYNEIAIGKYWIPVEEIKNYILKF